MATPLSLQSLFTWKTPKGELSLVQKTGSYSFQLLDKNQKTIEIFNQHIRGLHLDIQPEQCDQICVQYFPEIKQENNEEFRVIFHLSVVPEGQPLSNLSSAGSSKGNSEFKFNNLESKRAVNFSKDAPFYRRVTKGLNLQGSCTNAVCEAFKKVIYIQKGFGTFNVPKEADHSQCPACLKKVSFEAVTNLGFWDCKYTIDGKQKEKEQMIKTDMASSEHFTTFRSGDDCVWDYLEVKTEAN